MLDPALLADQRSAQDPRKKLTCDTMNTEQSSIKNAPCSVNRYQLRMVEDIELHTKGRQGHVVHLPENSLKLSMQASLPQVPDASRQGRSYPRIVHVPLEASESCCHH